MKTIQILIQSFGLIVLLNLAACGQTGALYLPEESVFEEVEQEAGQAKDPASQS